MSDKNEPNWKFDKTINVAHILTTVVIVVSILSWANTVDQRLTENTTTLKYLKEKEQKQWTRLEELRKENKNDLREINRKLDRLIEKQ